MAVVATPAILLRAYPYSETSRVLRLYTRDLGLVGAMARGARRGASKGRGGAGTFGEGVAVIVYRENRDLQTLREFSPSTARMGLGRDFRRLAGASVGAELVLRHAAQEPHPELFDTLSAGLERLAEAGPGEVRGEVLALCWAMVRLLGFGPELEVCAGCGAPLGERDMARLDIEAGGVRGPECSTPDTGRRIGPGARDQLGSLLRGRVPPELRGRRAHLALLDDFVTCHMLGGRRLDSFRFLDADPRPAPGPPR